ncbi:hypothetical protein HDU99_001397, partial [Rhizoclosmatium hyalinum]
MPRSPSSFSDDDEFDEFSDVIDANVLSLLDQVDAMVATQSNTALAHATFFDDNAKATSNLNQHQISNQQRGEVANPTSERNSVLTHQLNLNNSQSFVPQSLPTAARLSDLTRENAKLKEKATAATGEAYMLRERLQKMETELRELRDAAAKHSAVVESEMNAVRRQFENEIGRLQAELAMKENELGFATQRIKNAAKAAKAVTPATASSAPTSASIPAPQFVAPLPIQRDKPIPVTKPPSILSTAQNFIQAKNSSNQRAS